MPWPRASLPVVAVSGGAGPKNRFWARPTTTRSQDSPESERGSGTVLALALVAVLTSAIMAVAALAGSARAQLQAAAAADLAAVAGAQALIDGLDLTAACTEARRVAVANRAQVDRCRAVVPGRIEVVCFVPVTVPWMGPQQASARAVAGPP
ncbi:MAG: hypothetical protein LBO75_01550 [Bifidobacteriaceae bacterium]|jgi:secretion/DNA translocation related TadE-like protein|nr:hypothetical protein [Bifidobacteriaceae bacterium]